MFLGVFEASLQNANVLVDDGFAFVTEGVCEHAGGNLKIEAKKKDQCADGHCVLHNRGHRSKRLEQLRNRKRRGEYIVANRDIDLEFIGIEQDCSAGFDFGGVALDGILIEGDESVEMIAVRIDLVLAQAQTEPDMATADNRLVAIEAIGI